ncbi:MAG: antibiotic biosynthesis monooxygenase [Acidobacteria bacterium]|nr:antibiotic biosynthesis monooxygenase [Acidobacteriota bacterium]
MQRRHLVGVLAVFAASLAGAGGPAAGQTAPAAEPAGPRFVVTYVDVVPASEAQALALLKGYRDAARRDHGNADSQIWQQNGVRGHFVIVEQWQDEASRKAHREAAHVAQFHEKFGPLRISSYDERVHTSFAVGAPSSVPSGGAVLVATHIDITPPGLDKAREMLRSQAPASRGEAGNLRFDILQGARQNHYTVLEAWRDDGARDAHLTATRTRSYREGLREQAVDGAPYDERLYRLVP